MVVYLRQEGRGIGLINKLKAYSLQDLGLDTVEANERLGFPADLRNYGVGAQILNDLGIRKIRLITNNPRKIAGLEGYGSWRSGPGEHLVMDPGTHNAAYLAVKRSKLGHLMGDGPSCPLGLTAVLAWSEATDASGGPAAVRAERLDHLQAWALEQGLLLGREEHPRLLALLNQPDLALLLSSGSGADGPCGSRASPTCCAGWPPGPSPRAWRCCSRPMRSAPPIPAPEAAASSAPWRSSGRRCGRGCRCRPRAATWSGAEGRGGSVLNGPLGDLAAVLEGLHHIHVGCVAEHGVHAIEVGLGLIGEM